MKPEQAQATTGTAEGEAQRDSRPQPGAGTPAEPQAAATEPAPQAAPEPAPPDPLAQMQADLDKARAAIAEQYDKYLRLQAEFENYKKRTAREQAEQMRFVYLPLLRDLAGVMDDLERALQHGRGEKVDAAAVIAGVELVAKQVAEVFQRYGVARIKAVGQPFDPNRHQAVSVVETGTAPENYVIEEFRPGYLLHDRVLRPAMVSVARKAEGNGVAKDAKDAPAK
jgi:molecular chaperone GrpE